MERFDFSKKRVYHNGKPMTKFDMGYYLEHCGVSSYYWYGLAVTLNESVYSYLEVREKLFSFVNIFLS